MKKHHTLEFILVHREDNELQMINLNKIIIAQ